jgi:hypothetical protein
VSPRSSGGTVVAGLIVMLVVAACASVEPAPSRSGSAATASVGAPGSGTQAVQPLLPAGTPISTLPPTPTATLPSAPTPAEPPTPSETAATDRPGSGQASPPGPSLQPRDTTEPLDTTEPTDTTKPLDTTAPAPSQSPQPTLGPGAGLGADTLQSEDDFSQPGSWGTATDAAGSVAYAGATLAITVDVAGSGLWSWHIPPLPKPHRVLRVEGTIDVGSTRGGLMCGNGNSDFLFGVISWDGRWYVGSIVSKATVTLASGDLPDGAVPDPNGHAHLSIECAVTGGTTDRVLLRVNGIEVADFDAAPHLGPFDHAAVYGEAGDSPPQTVTFDDVTVTSGDTYTPNGVLDPEVQDLLSRVPHDFRSDCTPNQPAGDAGLVAWLVCTPAGDVDEAQYYAYRTKSAMNTAFDSHLKRDGPGATGVDCEERPSTVNYTIRNPNTGAPEHAGRLSCYPDPDSSGRLYMWTDEKLAVLSFGVSSGSYMDLWNWWLDAGPNR